MQRFTRVRYWRLQRLMSQKDLATAVEKATTEKTTEATISRIENGSGARMSTIKKLAQALGVEPQQLYTDATDPERDQPQERSRHAA